MHLYIAQRQAFSYSSLLLQSIVHLNKDPPPSEEYLNLVNVPFLMKRMSKLDFWLHTVCFLPISSLFSGFLSNLILCFRNLALTIFGCTLAARAGTTADQR